MNYSKWWVSDPSKSRPEMRKPTAADRAEARKRRAGRLRARVAYHEAGHAVICFAFGQPILSVTAERTEDLVSMESPGDKYNEAVFRVATEDPPDQRAELHIALAGIVAEQMYIMSNRRKVPATSKTWQPDLEDAAAAAEALGADPASLMRDATKFVTDIFLSKWLAVVDIAEKLLRSPGVSGDEVSGVCTRRKVAVAAGTR